MQNNNEKFLDFYNKIETKLEEYKEFGDQNYKTFNNLLINASSKNRIIKNYKDELKTFSDLRNILSHKYKLSNSIAVPTDETINEIEKIYNTIINPNKIDSIMVRAIDIYKADLDFYIKDVIKKMKDNIYTHVPVYKNNDFIGIFSESTMIKYLGDNYDNDGCLLSSKKINDLVNYIDKENDSLNCFEFISKKTDIYSVEDKFESYIKKGKRLGVLLVTENGKNNESILGLITSWDLNKIN